MQKINKVIVENMLKDSRDAQSTEVLIHSPK